MPASQFRRSETFLPIPFLFSLKVALRMYGHFAKKFTKEQLASSAAATVIAEERFSSIRTVRSFAKEDASVETYAQAIKV